MTEHPDECYIRIDYFSKNGDESSTIKWTNSTEKIEAGQKFCLREFCNNKFVNEKCPQEGDKNRPEVTESGDVFTEEDIESEDFRCQPNKSFKLACNTCWCTADGKSAKYCTRIACNPKIYKPLGEL